MTTMARLVRPARGDRLGVAAVVERALRREHSLTDAGDLFDRVPQVEAVGEEGEDDAHGEQEIAHVLHRGVGPQVLGGLELADELKHARPGVDVVHVVEGEMDRLGHDEEGGDLREQGDAQQDEPHRIHLAVEKVEKVEEKRAEVERNGFPWEICLKRGRK